MKKEWGALLALLLISVPFARAGYSPFGDPHWKAPVASSGMLPTTGNSPADVRVDQTDFQEYIWNGSSWSRFVGVSGTTGAAGASGATGGTGSVGLSGATGATGATGPMGVSGSTGESGATGQTGLTGAAGSTGLTGASGGTGNVGASGASGSTGASGQSGLTGASGASGATGASGASGVTGASGSTGSQGMTGATGGSLLALNSTLNNAATGTGTTLNAWYVPDLTWTATLTSDGYWRVGAFAEVNTNISVVGNVAVYIAVSTSSSPGAGIIQSSFCGIASVAANISDVQCSVSSIYLASGTPLSLYVHIYVAAFSGSPTVNIQFRNNYGPGFSGLLSAERVQ